MHISPYFMNCWLLKSEPHSYSIDMLEKDIETVWDGVRNYTARNYMMQMKKGDLCLFYHSGSKPAIVGMADVISDAYLDLTDSYGKFYAINIRFKAKLIKEIRLSQMKTYSALLNMKIMKQTRLSISPVSTLELDCIKMIMDIK